MAFRTCAAIAFKRAFRQASPTLLEPVMSVNVTTPEEYAGGLISVLCAKRGRITGMEPQGNIQIVKAMCPLANLFGYTTELRNSTQGHAAFTMHFEHYEAVPFSIAEEIIEQRKKRQKRK